MGSVVNPDISGEIDLRRFKMVQSSICQTILFIIILSINQLFSADPDQKVTVSLFSSNQKISSVEMNIHNIFNEELESKHIYSEDYALWDLLIVIKAIDAKTTILSITTLQSLPKEVIEAGASSQIFYASLEKDKSLHESDKNQEIRKYVTSEFLSNYMQVVNSEIFIAQNEKITDTCKKIVNNFINKYMR